MKRKFTRFIVITSAGLFIGSSILGQSPEKMSYQAVVRNSDGQLITNHEVGMKVSILQGSATGTLVYQEIYNPNPQTNINGLVSIEVGGGIPMTGSFTNIDWSAGPYFLKTETDPAGGTSYSITGATELLTVPYAFHAKKQQFTMKLIPCSVYLLQAGSRTLIFQTGPALTAGATIL